MLEDILAVHREAFLIRCRRANGEVFLFLAPRDRERVVGPQTNRWDVQIGVLARAEGPWARHANSDTESIARKYFDVASGTAISNVAHDKAHESPDTLHDPEGKHSIEHKLLRALLKMNPHGAEGNGGTDDVAVKEDLVERVTDGGWRLDQKEDECNGSLNVSVMVMNKGIRYLR